MNYRLATQSDALELARLRWDFRLEETGGVAKTAWEEFSAVCADFVATGIAAGDWQYWVAEDSARLTGCVCMHVIRKVPKPNKLVDRFGYVTNVYMRPEHRNGGHGTELLKRAIDWARAEGLGELMVSPSERSVLYYMRQGFKPDHEMLHLDLLPYVL